MTLATLVLVLTGLLAAGLGFVLARRGAERAMREVRAELQAQQLLRSEWLWQTDAGHQLLLWRPPAGTTIVSCPLFDTRQAGHERLAAQLRAQQPFADLVIPIDDATGTRQAWTLRAVPRLDDNGGFAGYLGHARCDAAPASSPAASTAQGSPADAMAIDAVLSAWPVAAMVALRGPDGSWRVRHANAAARALWPSLGWPMPLRELVDHLPQPAADALLAAAAANADAPPIVADGWKIERHGSAGTGPQLVITQAVEPAGAAARRDEESNSFSFTVSHDLRAPIRVVEGFTRIVKEDYGPLLDKVGNDHLERVLGAAARMNTMIDALLALARLSQQPLSRQPVNLSLLAGYVVDDLRRAHPEREVEVEVQPGLATTGDPTLLRLVLENLLGNAWKYSSRAERAQISLRAAPHQGALAYVVRDNGAGFDMRSADRLFGLFQRLHSASDFPGTGVGLASVRRIVQRHGGDIWAEAEPGRGAAFFFTLAG